MTAGAEISASVFSLLELEWRGQASPWPDSRGGCLHMTRALMPMMPNAIPRCEKLQHFVYLKLENKVIV
jgi:hypothetical protein